MRRLFGLVILGIILSGCGSSNASREEYEVEVPSYEKKQSEEYIVTRGDIEQKIKLELKAKDVERVSYFSAAEPMKIEEMSLAEGDMVEEGQLLIKFKEDDELKELDDYRTRLEEDQLLIEHYNNLIEMGATEYTSEDIELIKNDMIVCQTYINELEEKKKKYSIYATGRGVITKVSKVVSYGVIEEKTELVVVMYGEGLFETDVDEIDGLEIGKVYQAEYAQIKYDLKLLSIEKKGDKNHLVFEYVSLNGEFPGRTVMNMEIKIDPIKNAIYVPSNAVIKGLDDKNYVVVLDENGFGYAREVQVLVKAGEYTAIKSGLEEGEKVAVKR